MEHFGYAGKCLFVDLTSGRIKTEPLDMEKARKFLGGIGLSGRLLCDILKSNIDPLSPDNPIIITAGPFVGTPVPQSSKIELITKSATPANKEQSKYAIGWSMGGTERFGVMMKKAGYDQIVITGKASSPVYLKVIDDDVEICDAADLWGKKDIYETSDELASRYKGSGVFAIGEAGENRVTFAIGMVDKNATLGRNGGATVMGSKNIKAIVVNGSGVVKIHDSKTLKTMASSIQKKAVKIPELKKPGVFSWEFDGEWAERYPLSLWDESLIKISSCATCRTGCHATYRIRTGEFAGAEFGFGAFLIIPKNGKYLELKDYRHAMKLAEMCNRYGICLSTASAMMRFVTALYERGVITTRDTGGLELKMGDIYAYLKLIEQIAYRADIGDTMANGWYALAERVGMDEAAYEDSRGVFKGISVVTDNWRRRLDPFLFEEVVNLRGAKQYHPLTYRRNITMNQLKEWCRNLAMSEEEINRIFTSGDFNCARLTKHVEDGEAVYFSLGICMMNIVYELQSIKKLARFYPAATGIELTPEELKKAGERIHNLYKLLNLREGFTRGDDAFPELWIKSTEQQVKSPLLGELKLKTYFGNPVARADLDQMIDDYYDEHGWDVRTGIPTAEKLHHLGLEDFAEVLPK